MRLLVIVSLLAIPGLLLDFAAPASVVAQEARDMDAGVAQSSINVAARRKVRKIYSEQGQIACTKLGCQRIPANCHPETAYYWNGLPTGYDRIACR